MYFLCVLTLFVITADAQFEPCVCGKEKKDRSLPPILQYPWYSWFEFKDVNGVKRGCLGTLIHEKFVLFDPKCLGDDLKTSKVEVVFGGNAIIGAGDFSQLGNIIRYNNENKKIALVKLTRDVTCKPQVQPICTNLTTEFKINSTGNITVNGLNSNDYWNQWPVMVAVNTSFIDTNDCSKELKIDKSELEDKICLKHHEYCMSGVFGGALSQNFDGKSFMIGMKSNDLCNKGKPTVHTKLSFYGKWIEQQIKNSKN